MHSYKKLFAIIFIESHGLRYFSGSLLMLRTWEEKYAVLLDLEVAHLCLGRGTFGF